MEKQQRSKLQTATQDARKLLEEEFRSQLLQTYDIDVEKVRWAEEPGAHLQAEQRLIREKLIAWIEHKEAQIHDRKEALLLSLREMAFTALNRFVALKLMEARELVRPCVSGGLESAGFLEFTAVAQGLLADQESSYRLYLETIFEDVSRELRALFDPRDPASLLWTKRAALLELLDILNRPELAELWIEDETLGWVYQYFNGDAERKKMREESSAPRNSRELAVRNQFFTPRYVVEFLTDNTLGRIWYEMRQGNSGLKDRCRYLVRRPNEVWLQPVEEAPPQPDTDEALSQEELLRQPVHISHRPLKDPREIRMLDPACGSMHFGLYAFDLYLAIYEEAWEIAQGSDEQAKQGEAFAAFVAYGAGFTDKAAFLSEVPRLILQHNIHGIDIDPRATQIARLTLWLRAQRDWKEQALAVAARPSITRSNVVCAEPMPGERELLADFVDQQFPDAERGLVQQFLESIFDKMQLAGEAGSLLKIEEEIRDAIDQARREWQILGIQQTSLLGARELASIGIAGSVLNADIENLTSNFWINTEDRIFTALRDYAGQAEDSCDFQRRLFSDDASRGFALIDICRKRFDAVLMNPPFGAATPIVFAQLKRESPDTYTELYASFVNRGMAMVAQGGRVGAITSRAFLYIGRLSEFRKNRLADRIDLMLDLAASVMDDAFVEACAYTVSADSKVDAVIALDARGVEDRAVALDSISSLPRMLPCGTYVAPWSRLRRLPANKFLYYLSPKLCALLDSSSTFEPEIGTVRQGMGTFNDFRFVHLLWEISPQAIGQSNHWEPLAKGGAFSKYYGQIHLAVNWWKNGAELCEVNRSRNGQTAQVRQASDYWRLGGCTYSKRSIKGFSARALPKGCIMAGKGPAIISQSDNSEQYFLGWLNSRLITGLIELQANASEFNTGILKALPWVQPDHHLHGRLGGLSHSMALASRALKRLDETDQYYVFAPELGGRLSEQIEALRAEQEDLKSLLLRGEQEIDQAIDELYLVDSTALMEAQDSDAMQDDDEEEDGEAIRLDIDYSEFLVSGLLGAVFGRWNILYAIDKDSLPSPPDPFDALPVCPHGMLKNGDGLPAGREDISHDYPLRISWPGILVDDQSSSEDVVFRIGDASKAVWQDKGAGIELDICGALGVSSLRDYFRNPAEFFSRHLRRYSKSRRQAPVYWQLSCGSGSYSAWLYYHRFTQDTLYRVLRDFVEPRIQQAERDQFELESQGSLSGEAANRLQEAQTLLQDLRLFKSELDLVAPLWNPNLNDGVIINHAILWRITPYTPWQKKCKECWDKLVKGDYDWAHLAFHLWPERVIPKCTTDRSLAIAHGLEERLWQETNNGNWLPRQLSEADLQALIAEHSNSAVKSALERFLAAPPPVAPTRTRASRSTRASGSSTPRRARGSAAVVDAEATRQVLLALTAAPSDGLAKATIADLIGVEANALTAVIKQLKENGQIDQLGERRGARYVLSEQGRARLKQEEES